MVFREFVLCHKGPMLIKVISCEKPFLDKKNPTNPNPHKKQNNTSDSEINFPDEIHVRMEI